MVISFWEIQPCRGLLQHDRYPGNEVLFYFSHLFILFLFLFYFFG